MQVFFTALNRLRPMEMRGLRREPSWIKTCDTHVALNLDRLCLGEGAAGEQVPVCGAA